MDIHILSVGKVRETYLSDGIGEYTKRLGRYCRLRFTQVADEPTPDGASPAAQAQILQKEGKRLLSHIRERDYVIALAIQGQAIDSKGLADRIGQLTLGGYRSLVFIIGGSLGLSGEVLGRADWQLSFSRLTFPHQLMQLILLEQIYRSFRILNHEPYHK